MLVSRQFAESLVTFDARYAPVLITIWNGRTDLEAAKWGMGLMDEAVHEAAIRGRRLVSISDASLAKNPTADVRKYFAEHTSQSMQRQAATVLSNYVVVDSALIRGAITAIGWLSEGARNVTSTATLARALDHALRDLDAHGISRPAGLSPESYRVPPPDVSKVG